MSVGLGDTKMRSTKCDKDTWNSSSSPNMRDPPTEVLQEILEEFTIPLAFHTDSLPDRATLLSCSLVCKRWAREAQRLLFRRALINDRWKEGWTRVHSVDAVTSFRDTITANTAKSLWLRQTVVSIVLRPAFTIHPSQTFSILVNLPNLREINLEGVECIFTEDELFQLRNTGPRICSLRIHPDPVGPRTTSGRVIWPAIIRLIAALPTLRMLDITAVDNFEQFVTNTLVTNTLVSFIIFWHPGFLRPWQFTEASHRDVNVKSLMLLINSIISATLSSVDLGNSLKPPIETSITRI
ncbi:hypothetical protein C8R45DRAFT_1073483 [Mycena sanguinolenta]|nr:hypothetical protein C8R45DRAFT_1073483 [Mycena sanguinolenta]